MASACFVALITPASSSSLVSSRTGTAKRFVSWSCSSLPPSNEFGRPRVSCSLAKERAARARVSGVLDVLGAEEEETAVTEEFIAEGLDSDGDYDKDGSLEEEWRKPSRPCELYVCNLPTSYDIEKLLEMFKPFGSVQSVEISRNAETGVSRGCGYVTMDSIDTARVAIATLDGSDVGGREMRVRFSVEMNPRRRNPELLNSAPQRQLIYESPYKLYVGNLPWDARPEILRNHFNRFGTVVSTRVLQDRKAGKRRCYAFLSFSSAAERDAAMSLNSTEFLGRSLVVRHGVDRTKP